MLLYLAACYQCGFSVPAAPLLFLFYGDTFLVIVVYFCQQIILSITAGRLVNRRNGLYWCFCSWHRRCVIQRYVCVFWNRRCVIQHLRLCFWNRRRVIQCYICVCWHRLRHSVLRLCLLAQTARHPILRLCLFAQTARHPALRLCLLAQTELGILNCLLFIDTDSDPDIHLSRYMLSLALKLHFGSVLTKPRIMVAFLWR